MAEKESAPKTLRDVIAKAQKSYDLRVGSLASVAADVRGLTTGNIAIDAITGIGGLPCGRATELFGPPSSGKTTTGLQLAALAQKAGLNVGYFDYEQSVEQLYAAALGVDVEADSFLFCQPDTIEQGFDVWRDMLRTGQLGVAIFDSVAMMTPNMVIEAKEMGNNTGALNKARLMAEGFERIKADLAKSGCVAVFLNHIRDVVDMSPSGVRLAHLKRKTTPGGVALKFFASMRIEYKPIGGIKGMTTDELTDEDSEHLVGTTVKVTCVKNKVAAPFRSAEVRVAYGRGFIQSYSVLSILTARKIVRKDAGGIYRVPPELEVGLDIDGRKDTRAIANMAYIKGEGALLAQLDKDPKTLEVWLHRAKQCLSDPDALVSADLRATALDEVESTENLTQVSAPDLQSLLTSGTSNIVDPTKL